VRKQLTNVSMAKLCIALDAIDGRKICAWLRDSHDIVSGETSHTRKRTPIRKP
jgi:hypothetical protein